MKYDFTVFAKEIGGELQRYVAHNEEDYLSAMSTVRSVLPAGARVTVDLSLTVPTEYKEPEPWSQHV